MTTPEIKAAIWAFTKDLSLINKAKAYYVNDDSPEYWQRVFDYIQIALPPPSRKPAKKKSGVKLTPEHLRRYRDAHESWFKAEYPNTYKDGHYTGMEPEQPDVGTANGLQTFIVNYLDWNGGYGNRINTMGRQINGKWIKGSTKKGTGDVSGIVNGKAITFEVKIGRDKPSDKQLLQQSRIKRAGGEYFFVKTVQEFFEYYDGLVVT